MKSTPLILYIKTTPNRQLQITIISAEVMKNEIKIPFEHIALQPVVLPDDEEFLIALYYTTRDDIQLAPINEEQKKLLSFTQYIAQKQHYETFFPGSKHNMIMVKEERVGRLWTARNDSEIICVNISLVPEYRNRGIGTILMTQLFTEAEQSKRVLNLHVLKTNEKALRLYKRLNCKLTGETFSHFKMQWRPENEFIRST